MTPEEWGQVDHLFAEALPLAPPERVAFLDRSCSNPEVRREVANELREVARQVQHFLSKQEHVHMEKRRLSVFAKYLPRIAQFSATLAGKQRIPDIEKLLKSVQKYGDEEN